MKHFFRILIALAATVQIARAAPRAEHVFIVSFDGGAPDVMKRSTMPTFFEMSAQGAATMKAQTIFPSLTLPSHTSMLTGVGPDKHQILWNGWEPQRGLVKVPTVFQVAREHGYTTALFAGKIKFRHLNVPGTLDEMQIPAYEAQTVADAAARYIVEKKPNLCFVHFADSDGAGHEFGWNSAQQIKAFGDEDVALRTLRAAVEKAGIAGSSTFILSADHGGHGKGHGTNLPVDMTIPWVAWGAGVKPGFAIQKPVTTYDTAATALWLLEVPVPASWDGHPVESAFVSQLAPQAN